MKLKINQGSILQELCWNCLKTENLTKIPGLSNKKLVRFCQDQAFKAKKFCLVPQVDFSHGTALRSSPHQAIYAPVTAALSGAQPVDSLLNYYTNCYTIIFRLTKCCLTFRTNWRFTHKTGSEFFPNFSIFWPSNVSRASFLSRASPSAVVSGNFFNVFWGYVKPATASLPTLSNFYIFNFS